jgi:hypothetical protein
MKRNTAFSRPQSSITGRDGYIVMRALGYAIVAIGMQLPRWQEWSDRADMLRILEEWESVPDSSYFITNAAAHLQHHDVPVDDGKLILAEPIDGTGIH